MWSDASACLHCWPSAGMDGRGGWRLLSQGPSLWGHRKCQDGVGMEEELAQNETRQHLQASLFSILMSPAMCSASADLGSMVTARQPHSPSQGPLLREARVGFLSTVRREQWCCSSCLRAECGRTPDATSGSMCVLCLPHRLEWPGLDLDGRDCPHLSEHPPCPQDVEGGVSS